VVHVAVFARMAAGATRVNEFSDTYRPDVARRVSTV
jgi:hypothetical protein